MSLQAKHGSSPIGLYCHVPFCASSCDFCAFYQEPPRREAIVGYLRGMEREFALLPAREVDTVFWGGGTPGLLPAGDLDRLGRAMLANLASAPREWTVEMAPSTVKADKLRALRDLGVTRVSLGAQSFDEARLRELGRLHRPNQIEAAWERVAEAGLPSTNIDLIFAIPGQTEAQWEADLRRAMALGPDHISTYCLTFEEDTALYARMLAGGAPPPDSDREAELYERAMDVLETGGFRQYEISNFARPGAECRHNMNTWRMGEWLGCGPAAASQIAGERFRRPADLEAWRRGAMDGAPPKEERVALDAETLFVDALVFGARMNAGVDVAEAERRFGAPAARASLEPALRRLAAEGTLEREGDIVRPSRHGRLLADAVGRELMEAAPPPAGAQS